MTSEILIPQILAEMIYDKIEKEGLHCMTSDAQKRASAKYDAENTTGLYLKLNKKTDADIIDWLGSIDNKQGYIKSIIRDDISSAKGLKEGKELLFKEDVIDSLKKGITPSEPNDWALGMNDGLKNAISIVEDIPAVRE